MAMTHDEMIAVIQAHKEGKTIQCIPKNIPSAWSVTKSPCWNFERFDYRVESTPTWRPFTMEDYAKNFDRVIDRRDPDGLQLVGVWRPIAYDHIGVFDGTNWTTYEELLDKGHRFIDTGERCGILES